MLILACWWFVLLVGLPSWVFVLGVVGCFGVVCVFGLFDVAVG